MFTKAIPCAGYKKFILTGLLFVGSLFPLTSCDLASNYNKADRAANAETQDFRDALTERQPEDDKKDGKGAKGAGIPELEPYVYTQSSLKPVPLVSVSINQSVPLKDALFELAEQAGYDIELDPRISGAIIFTARNKPFDEVMAKICEMAGLRHKIEDGSIRVELDEPYNKIYKVDYLNLVRSNKSSVSTNISVVSGDGADTGSEYSVSSEGESDFWAELDSNMKQVLGGASTGALKTKSNPKISSVEEEEEEDADTEDDADAQDKDSEDLADSDKKKEKKEEKPKKKEAVLRVDSLPVGDDGEVMDAAAPAGGDDEGMNGATYSINKQAGIINVFATERAHKLVDNYLKVLRRSITSQVLIEAKVFEVELNDEFITGIDWGALGGTDGKGFMSFVTDAAVTTFNGSVGSGVTGFPVSPPDTASVVAASNLTVGYVGRDLQALVTAISGFGTVRALASPRLTIMNNQSGVLNVATNRVFFKMDIDHTDATNDAPEKTEISSEIKSVPEGVLINVQPSIDLDSNTISLSVRPSVTRVVGTKNDPAVAFVAAAVTGGDEIVSAIPEVNIQEIDTMVKVNSGDAIVMGGLLQDRTNSLRESVPVLGEMPVMGALFRKHTDLVTKTELVIFLKATLLESPEDSVHDTDKDLYRKFSGDRRPLKL